MMRPAQRVAIFAAMRDRRLSIDDVRAMTPRNSISDLTIGEAGQLLNRLNHGTAYQREHAPSRATARAPARPQGVYTFVTHPQRDLIVAIRMELGWTESHLMEWLGKRHYRYDAARSMDRMESSSDAVAVIELLKHVRDRMLDPGKAPQERQLLTIGDRRARICRVPGWNKARLDQWLACQKFPDSRDMANIMTANDASLVIERLTALLSELCESSNTSEPRRAMQ